MEAGGSSTTNGESHSEALEAVGTLQWLADGQHVVYSRVGALATPTEAWLHRVGTPEALDRLLYEEVRTLQPRFRENPSRLAASPRSQRFSSFLSPPSAASSPSSRPCI